MLLCVCGGDWLGCKTWCVCACGGKTCWGVRPGVFGGGGGQECGCVRRPLDLSPGLGAPISSSLPLPPGTPALGVPILISPPPPGTFPTVN